MAAPIAQSLLQQIKQQFLTCFLCQKGLTKPLVLPCFHILCAECLDFYASRTIPDNGKALWLLCPVCREIVTLPKEGGDHSKFPQNDFVRFMVGNMEENLGKCDLGAEPKQDYSCCFCKLSDSHLYCSDCKKNCCSTCINQHLYHDISSLTDQAEKIKVQLGFIQHDMQGNLNNLQQILQQTRNYETDILSMRDELRKTVKQTANELRKAVKEIEEKMLKEINEVVKEECEKIYKNIDNCTVSIANEKVMHSIFDGINSCDKRNSANVLSSLDFLQKCLDELNKHHENYPMSLPKRCLKLHQEKPDYCSIMENLFGKFASPYEIQQNYRSTSSQENDESVTKSQGLTTNTKWLPNNYIFKSPAKGTTKLPNCDEFCSKDNEMESPSSEKETFPAEIVPVTNEILVGSFESCPLEVKEIQTYSVLTVNCLKVCKISGIACLPNDDIIIVVDKNNKCVKFLKEGEVFRKIYGSENLCDVTVLPNDQVAITDKTVHIFNTKGRLVGVLRQKPRDSQGITCASDGKLLVVDRATKSLYNLMPKPDIQGMYSYTTSPLPNQSSYIAIDKSGNLAFSCQTSNSVYVFLSASSLSRKITLSEDINGFGEPSGLCFDNHGKLFICDKNNHRIVVVDTRDGFSVSVLSVSTQLSYPSAVDIDKDSNLVIAEQCGRIRILSFID